MNRDRRFECSLPSSRDSGNNLILTTRLITRKVEECLEREIAVVYSQESEMKCPKMIHGTCESSSNINYIVTSVILNITLL